MTGSKPPPVDFSKILSFDLEVNRRDSVRQLGALLGAASISADQPRQLAAAFTRLDAWAAHCEAVLGHNICAFDLPLLRNSSWSLPNLFRQPIIDTLLLSPLAFPANPYHRLVKDYKIVRDSFNDPVADARIALQLFTEQIDALQRWHAEVPQLVRFYQYAFAAGERVDEKRQAATGVAPLLAKITGEEHISKAEIQRSLLDLAAGKCCSRQLQNVLVESHCLDQQAIPVAYLLAWLQVAGGNSVLPPWVRASYPVIVRWTKQLRAQHCGHAQCGWCSEQHNARRHLQNIFELADFRSLPNGQNLQEEVVKAGLADKSLLAVLPTGGGKSLCYQLPALVRNQRCGSLTIVISPLQALMKDQVDSLRSRAGVIGVAAMYGLLTLPERGAVLEQVRMGDIALLYVSPEQLRNPSLRRVLKQREIGAWVFDEVHCLSKWGHDFRPDYLYCARFIGELAEQQQMEIPAICCFTATAKPEVITDIVAHFSEKLQRELQQFIGPVERNNLSYKVHETNELTKYGQIVQILNEYFAEGQSGSAVIYGATRNACEEITQYIKTRQGNAAGLTVEFFHAGLQAFEKKDVLERFISGDIRVICATNAFGMGIDKDDVRVVIHADIPGSLENYVQEAGRAGRDSKPADCILLFDEEDIETQFQLSALSKVSDRDIRQILKGVRLKVRGGNETIVTSAELLRLDEVETSFDQRDRSADTKVKTALAWLERANLIQRNENQTQVFSGRPLFKSIDEAMLKLDTLNLSPARREQWRTILLQLVNAEITDGIKADDLAEAIGGASNNNVNCSSSGNLQAGDAVKEVMRALAQMADAGLLEQGLEMTAYLRPKGRNSAPGISATAHAIETQLLALLREQMPDDHENIDQQLSLRWLNQALLDAGQTECNPQLLLNLLKVLEQDGKISGQVGSLSLRYLAQGRYSVSLNRSWQEIQRIADQRQQVVAIALHFLCERIPSQEREAQQQLLIGFSFEELLTCIKHGMPALRDSQTAIYAAERALLYLHDVHAIIMQQGLAVFHQAMKINVIAAKGSRYTANDYQPLKHHYGQRIVQIHIMHEFAKLGVEKIRDALELVANYFTLDNLSFVQRYFKGRRNVLDYATSESSWRSIVESLNNKQQASIVTAHERSNMLVLAGPGAGKTRVIVHRCAWLVRVKRVRPESILVLCYNYNAALTLRRRLRDLLGKEARRLTVLTFHGFGLRLVGMSLQGNGQQTIDFDAVLEEAIALLSGTTQITGIEDDQVRETLLAGFEHILVDEYQDIKDAEYRLIAAITGKNEKDSDNKLSILAVGDDDQSIYGFSGANVEFIRRYCSDYNAETVYLTANYRSTKNIITASNQLIEHNRDRMKIAAAITVDVARQADPPGGLWQSVDNFSQGRVQLIECRDAVQQAQAVVAEITRIMTLDSNVDYADIAVLSRFGVSKPELMEVRAALEEADLPYRYRLDRDSGFSVHDVREIQQALARLEQLGNELLAADQLFELLHLANAAPNYWTNLLSDLLEAWREQSGDEAVAVAFFSDFLREYLLEQRRETRFGSGVLLSTVHGVKGEEYAHVIMLDDGWSADVRSVEESRRLYYVGMTRARHSLVLMQRTDRKNPHLKLLEEQPLYSTRATDDLPIYNALHFAVLGMRQLNISFAGRFQEDHPVHERLAQLSVGDRVTLEAGTGNRIGVFAQEGKIAELSRSATREWVNRLPLIVQVRVLAIIQRNRNVETQEYARALKVPRWELPMLEVRYR